MIRQLNKIEEMLSKFKEQIKVLDDYEKQFELVNDRLFELQQAIEDYELELFKYDDEGIIREHLDGALEELKEGKKAIVQFRKQIRKNGKRQDLEITKK